MDAIERNNWLAHRWPIEKRMQAYGGWTIHIAEVDGQRVFQATDPNQYDMLLKKHRPVCLARFVARERRLHPPVVLIVADTYRLGRIPPELWCGYDVTPLLDMPPVTLLSAKARAVFPAWPQALIRIVREDGLATLGLEPAPAAKRQRLRVVV